MRECIYCGKSLEKGELCNCAMSIARRKEKAAKSAQNEEPKRSEQAKTAKQDKKTAKQEEKARKKTEKERRKQESAARKNQKRESYSHSMGKNVFLNIWNNIKEFLKRPTETLMNPIGMGKAEVILLSVFEGVICGLCIFSIVTGASRGSFAAIGSLMGLKGVDGYNAIIGGVLSAVAGAITGPMVFFIYTAIFYAISRWLFRLFTTFWDYARRLVFATLPLTLIGTVGVVLGLFSQTTFSILLLCGLAGSVAVTYEILRAMWSAKSAARTLYGMMLGLFVFLTIIMYIAGLYMM